MADLEIRQDEIWHDNEPFARIYPNLSPTARDRAEEALEAGVTQLEGFLTRLRKLNSSGLFSEAEIESAWGSD